MGESELLVREGVVVAVLPNLMYRVVLDEKKSKEKGNKEKGEGRVIIAYLAGKLKRRPLKINVKDRVRVEFSPYNIERGRIVFRFYTKKVVS